MKPEKIRELDTKELEAKLAEMEENMFRLRFQLSMGQTTGLKKMREIRKDRARILTILGERKAAKR